MPYGIDGFLGTRASLMLDVVALVMFVLLPALAWSVYLVKYRQKYALHKKIQLTLGVVLLVTVGLFEVDVRLGGWRHRADASPFASPPSAIDWVWVALAIHLCFAITAAVLWIVVIVRALRQFPSPPTPSPHSAWHRRFAMAAAVDMACTAVTGLIFYYIAFVA